MTMFTDPLFYQYLGISLSIGIVAASLVDSLSSVVTINKRGGLTFIKLGRFGCSVWVSKK